ncbi:hypothetical protein SAMN05444672_1655 [Bacillus sp. OK838]|nr:hypothetical protein SAMN05444672_1655 [Bacillus sp. OK838]
MLMIVGKGVSSSRSDDIIGISFGLIAAAFYAALLLLNKFIKNMGKLELTIIQPGTTTLLLIPYLKALVFLKYQVLPFLVVSSL